MGAGICAKRQKSLWSLRTDSRKQIAALFWRKKIMPEKHRRVRCTQARDSKLHFLAGPLKVKTNYFYVFNSILFQWQMFGVHGVYIYIHIKTCPFTLKHTATGTNHAHVRTSRIVSSNGFSRIWIKGHNVYE